MKTLLILLLLCMHLFAQSSNTPVTGQQLFKKCIACHGHNGEKKALGRSVIINQITEAFLVKAMKGYRDGTYGGSMKDLMKGQVASYSDSDIEKVAAYIASMRTNQSTRITSIKHNVTRSTTEEIPSPKKNLPVQQKTPSLDIVEGMVSERLVRSNGKKQSVYVIDPLRINNASPWTGSMQLLYDPAKITIEIPPGQLSSNYIVQGHLTHASQLSKQSFTPQVMQVESAEKVSIIKLKAKRHKNDITDVKAMVKHDMLTEKSAKQKRTPQAYLTRIKASVNKQLVFDMKTSPYLSRNPIIKFKYRSLQAPTLTLAVTDNQGIKEHLTGNIKTSDTNIAVTDPAALSDKTEASDIAALKNVFGDIALHNSNTINIKAPEVASNGGAVPIAVISNIKAKSVALFGTEEDGALKFICQWFTTQYSIIDYEVKIKLLNRENKVLVVIEGTDGKYYKAEKKVEVATGEDC